MGAQRLDEYLRETPLRWVLDLDAQLRALDWTPFDTGVRAGRAPLHPRVLVGLITYGLLRQQTSLRARELLFQDPVLLRGAQRVEVHRVRAEHRARLAVQAVDEPLPLALHACGQRGAGVVAEDGVGQARLLLRAAVRLCAGMPGGEGAYGTRPVGAALVGAPYQPYGGYFDLIGNVSEWTADRRFGGRGVTLSTCWRESGDAGVMADPLCAPVGSEVRTLAAGYYPGGGIDITTLDQARPGARNGSNGALSGADSVGFRCAR